jgi:tRNA(Ile)-lysidine synthase
LRIGEKTCKTAADMSKKNKYNGIFLHSIEKTVSDYNMLQPGDAVLVTVSGGPDSVALLHVMLKLSCIFSLRLGIAHLNHSLRGKESDKDAIFVEYMARRLDLPFYISKKDVRKYQADNRLSPEDAARRVRYSFFYKTAENYNFTKIALGHHADDNAELVLMNILRGAGHKGISGIPPVRESLTSGKIIIRPLIRLTREEILSFLKEEGLEYVTDQSNYDTSIIRNRIRCNLIPKLKDSYNPGIVKALNRLSTIVRDEEIWIDNLIDSILKKNSILRNDNELEISIPEIAKIDIAALRRIVRKSIKIIKGDLKRITLSHIDSIINLLEDGPSSWNIDLPERIRIRRDYDILFISKEKKPLRESRPEFYINEQPAFEYIIPQPEHESPFLLFLDRLNIYMKFSVIDNISFNISFEVLCKYGQKTAFFDMDRLSFPLTVRNVKSGDRFHPLGMKGAQKVKKYFINKKVTRQNRASTPVLLSISKIIWLVGYQIDESVKIKDSTERVLRVELLAQM